MATFTLVPACMYPLPPPPHIAPARSDMTLPGCARQLVPHPAQHSLLRLNSLSEPGSCSAGACSASPSPHSDRAAVLRWWQARTKTMQLHWAGFNPRTPNPDPQVLSRQHASRGPAVAGRSLPLLHAGQHRQLLQRVGPGAAGQPPALLGFAPSFLPDFIFSFSLGACQASHAVFGWLEGLGGLPLLHAGRHRLLVQ